MENDSFNDKLNELKGKLGKWFEEVYSYGPGADADTIGRIKRHVYLSIAGAVVALLFVVVAVGYSFMAVSGGSGNVDVAAKGEVVYVHIAKGMTSDDIGKLLVKKGVIDSTTKFWIATKLNGAASKFQVGTFAMNKDMNVGDALNILLNGKTAAVRVTIPEGLNVREMAKRFAEAGLVDEDEFLKVAKTFAPYDYIESVPQADYRIEGFLFPDTYDFSNDATPESIMQKMADEFDRKLTPEMRRQAKEKHLSIYELITLASLVEKEARFPEDRPMIAQVFFKRLAINMPLQTDTTLQYLLDAPKEDVSIEDTKMESPYNTYQHYGLPPGPIACPGMASIEAVLNPADTDYLYFVADRNGHNHYTNTYDEHLEVVNRVR